MNSHVHDAANTLRTGRDCGKRIRPSGSLVDISPYRYRGGTAIAVNVGSRFFLATARHVIPKGHQFAVVLRDSVVEDVSEFAARHVHPHFDVGLLELADKDVGLFGDNFVTPERFLLKLDDEEESPVTVIGYPGELISDADTHRISEEDYGPFGKKYPTR